MALPPLNQPTKGVRILKFICEYHLYPDGSLYFKRQYPIGEARQAYTQKKVIKKGTMKTQKALQEDIL